jgi:NhaA family Na+:H+ antiporter
MLRYDQEKRIVISEQLSLVLGDTFLLGISLSTYVGCKVLKTSLPSGVNWSHIAGASMLGGIGFTMSLFICGLSFTSPQFIEFSKLGIMIGSLVSGVLGFLAIRLVGISMSEPGGSTIG